MTHYKISSSKDKEDQTAKASKYPQGYFKDKDCRDCGTSFTPSAPSEHYCSNVCKENGATTSYLMRIYKITYKDYLRMLDEQDNKCKICHGEGFCMAEHHRLKLVVDHCHSTGKVRGLLCHNCNRALGLLKDSSSSLKRAIGYLYNNK